MENAAARTPDLQHAERYQVVALSTSHITEGDADALADLSAFAKTLSVMQRETGFFIKLSPEYPKMNLREEFSPALLNIIQSALDQGISMVELDNRAPEIDNLPTFDW
jgi:hypothetical protein